MSAPVARTGISPAQREHGRETLLWVVGSVLAAVVLGTLRFVYFYLGDVAAGNPQTLMPRVIDESTGAFFQAVVVVGWWWGYRRWLCREQRLGVLLTRHLIAFLLVSAVHTGLMIASRAVLYPLLTNGRYDISFLPMRFLSEMGNDVIGYASLIAVVKVYESYAERRRRIAAEETLRRELALSELELLRLQLQPHFLFNALNTIASTMYEDVRVAEELITGLAALLRASVRGAAHQTISLDEELELADHYVRMIGARFGDRVDVQFDIADEARDAEVPSMLLQPLLENALHHGEPSAGARTLIEVAATVAGLVTRIVVRNPIPARGGASLIGSPELSRISGRRASGMGIGLTSTRRRLAILYPDGAARLNTEVAANAFIVTVELPYAIEKSSSPLIPLASRRSAFTPDRLRAIDAGHAAPMG